MKQYSLTFTEWRLEGFLSSGSRGIFPGCGNIFSGRGDIFPSPRGRAGCCYTLLCYIIRIFGTYEESRGLVETIMTSEQHLDT